MKKILLGFFLGIFLASTTVIYAASGNMIEVFYGIEDIIINGKSNMPEQKPFMYNGSAYVPLRYVSEKLGYDVEWNGDTKTIFIGQINKDGVVYPGNGIESMNTQDNSPYGKINYTYMGENILDNIGDKHNSYITFTNEILTTEKMYIEFPTNSQHSKFEGNLALTEKYKSTKSNMKLNVYADDKLVFTEEIVAGYMPKKISVNIDNAIKVKLEVTNTSQDSELGIFEPCFN